MRGYFKLHMIKICKTAKKNILDDLLSYTNRGETVKADISVVCLPSFRKG